MRPAFQTVMAGLRTRLDTLDRPLRVRRISRNGLATIHRSVRHLKAGTEPRHNATADQSTWRMNGVSGSSADMRTSPLAMARPLTSEAPVVGLPPAV
jgi:hypothetical protein